MTESNNKLVFATNNKHKLEEVKQILEDRIEILSLSDINCNEDIPETADTLEGNAFLKASFVKEKFNLNCFADDTGLEVAALNNAPGVYSARYAGEGKVQRIISTSCSLNSKTRPTGKRDSGLSSLLLLMTMNISLKVLSRVR
jgi:Xanthosine triphosphate pyrophosphatase